MSAHGDDLRYFYSEHVGDAQVLAVTNVTTPSAKLDPGRYLIQFNTVAGGATKVWVRQGKFGEVVAAAAAPSTALDLTENPKPRIFTMVRPGGGDTTPPTDGLSFITDAGTVNAVITKVSRDRS